MHKHGLWRAVWAASGLALISVSVALASPPVSPPAEPARQDNPTLTPTATVEFFGPTATITPTLQPPPLGGGRVAVGELVVRFGPSQEWNAAGGLKYGDEVFPVARSVNGNWVVIDWLDGVGWILAELVEWDPNYQILALPTLLPPSTPIGGFPTLTPAQSSTVEATDAASETPTATSVPPSATPSPEPQITDTLEVVEATVTEAPVVAEAPDDPPQEEEEEVIPPAPESERAVAPLISAQMLRTGLLGLGGLLVGVVVLGYGTRFVSRQLELRRYRKGFVIQDCPVCQQGTLELDEHVDRVVGMAHIQRSVRCNVCRSVLREVKPGLWRYTIDPYVNPDLAEVYNGQQFSDQELPNFISDAAMYPPAWPDNAEDLDPEQVAQELIGELEERFIEDRAAWEVEEAARLAAEAAAAEEATQATDTENSDGDEALPSEEDEVDD